MTKKQSSYMPNLSEISLDEFKNELKTGRLLPSRKPLLDDIDTKFSIIKKAGINNSENLRDILKSSSKLKKLAKETNNSRRLLQALKT